MATSSHTRRCWNRLATLEPRPDEHARVARSVRHREFRDRDALPQNAIEDWAGIGVEDNGVGIGEEDLKRLGDQFFQARGSYDRRHDGTGLGLSIVKGLVALHAGQVQVRSRPDEGTRFTVRLPLDCEKARANIPPSKIVHQLVIEPTPAPKTMPTTAPTPISDPDIPVKISA